MIIKGLTKCLAFRIHFRSLFQIFSDAQYDVQKRPLNLFFRSKSLLDFYQALDHIYQHISLTPDIVYELPKLIEEVKKLEDNKEYIKLFSIKKLPILQDNQILKSTYVNAVKESCDNLSLADIYSIHNNLNILLQQDEKFDIFNRFQEQAISQIFKKILDAFVQVLPMFETNIKYSMLLLSKSLRVYNQQFTNYIKFYYLNNYRQFNMLQSLTILSYLSDNRSFPFNFFYKHKNQWISMIAPTPLLLDKNQAYLLKFIQILSKEKLFYCQKLIESCFNLILRNIEHLDATDLVRVLYYYSKGRFSDSDLLQAIISNLGKKIEDVKVQQMRLLLVGLGKLKFQSIQFIRGLGSNVNFFQAIKSSCRDQYHKDYFDYISKIISEPIVPKSQI